MRPEPIYRDLELRRTSPAAVGKMVQALIVCGGRISDTGYLTNGFGEAQVSYWTTFYKLKFATQEQLDKFHAAGFATAAPPKITGC